MERRLSEKTFVRGVVQDRVAVLTIDRPPVNALNGQTLLELEATFAEVVGDPEVKVVVITGGGQTAFVAGVDIKEIAALSSPSAVADAARKGQAVFDQIERADKPVIAAVNGVCLGGGNELAMACHMRIAGERARFGQTEVNLGLMPGWGGSQRLPRIVGKAKALELMLSGDMISAQEALRIGLVNKVVPDGEVLKAARDLARRIAAKSAVSTRLILEAVREGENQPLQEGLGLEVRQFVEAQRSEDAREGVTAFFEKRQPQFRDR